MTTQQPRRVSPLRLAGVLGVTAALGAGGATWAVQTVRTTFVELAAVSVAPYVDVTLTPVSHFEDPQQNPLADVVLSFVVADPHDACTPNWGSYYDLDAASRALDLDRRIARLRERGGDIAVSFGGALNDELARVCTDHDELLAAYQSVIDRYQLVRLDFDIEGEALADRGAHDRRAAVLAELQLANPGLQIWLTVPVAPSGMTADAVDLIDRTLAGGVRLDGVNVMTMNYGGSRPAAQSMADANEAALNATFQQLSGAFQRAGQSLSPGEVWTRIGATPMIGRNDVATDIFDLDDADALIAFARDRKLGRLSFWSANRDRPCGVQLDPGQVSNSCSGVEQGDVEFGLRFNDATAPVTEPERDDADASGRQGESRDDPSVSPYPIWQSDRVYEEGDKVVWHRNVYQAKWWTQSDLPDAPVAELWDTPWRYLGPVLPGDADELASPAVDGRDQSTAIRWSDGRVFVAGDVVTFDGELFRATWWTQGDEPQVDPERAFDHPWEHLGPAPEDEESDAA